jgi:hypothetical protein
VELSLLLLRREPRVGIEELEKVLPTDPRDVGGDVRGADGIRLVCEARPPGDDPWSAAESCDML